MDVHHRNTKLEMKSELKVCEETQIKPMKTVKRPFDVAFLMRPDEKLKQKQVKIVPPKESPVFDKESDLYYNNNQEDEEIDVEDSCEYKTTHHKFFTQKQQIFDDPSNAFKHKTFDDQCNVPKNKQLDVLRIKSPPIEQQKSAFTKVNLTKEPSISPSLSMSPDLSYQNSLSPSPPVVNRGYQNFSPLSHNQLKNPPMTYQTHLLPENFQQQQQAMLEGHFLKSHEFYSTKFRPAHHRPDLAYGYQLSNQQMLKIPPHNELKFTPDIRNPAAAILTSLLPPSLAALSLPAQNVCAKCNITFRMTSDLVYHMRSHHKNENCDTSRKRREDKLKCPVCAESFRERHHLTRHMTAHQDKDEDEKSTKD